MKPGAPDLPEDAELDKAVLAKARDFRARAHARLLKAETPEQRASAELSVKVGEAFVAKMLAAPHRARARDSKMAAELAAIWRPMRHLVETVEAQGREMQNMQTGLQQVQTAVQSLASAIEADRPARDEVSAAIGQFYKNPEGAALAALSRHRSEDVAREKADAERATKKWDAKRQKLEAEIARQQKVLDNFHYQHDVEPDPIRRQALTKHLTEMMTAHTTMMDRLSEHIDAQPH